MDLRVFHPTFINMTVTLPSNRTVLFDENGVSPELTREEYDLLVTCRDFRSVASLIEEMTADALQDALPLEGEIPVAVLHVLNLPALQGGETFVQGISTAGTEDEEVPEHDPDANLLEQFRDVGDPKCFFYSLKLTDRLDLASDHRLTDEEASRMFAWETEGRKSKRIQTALDRKLGLLRQTKSAESVNQALLTANFPRVEES